MSVNYIPKSSNICRDEFPYEKSNINGCGVVYDKKTGLYWEVKSAVSGAVNYCLDTYTFDEAQSIYIGAMNAKNYGGFSDWRMPNKDELRSILDYAHMDPAIDLSIFENCQTNDYWTCNIYTLQPYFAWILFFGFGSATAKPTGTKHYVMAVRGGKDALFGVSDSSRFVINGDGTVTDTVTNLMWQQGENERCGFEEAKANCKALRLGGYDDWRLPDIKELNTILNLNHSDDGIWFFRDIFPAVGLERPMLHYYASDTYCEHFVWVTNFCFGYDGYYAGKHAPLLHRAVRRANNLPQAEHNYCLPHTGQTLIYDVEGNITTDEAYGGLDGLRVTYSQKLQVIEDGCAVFDENTGLMWERFDDKKNPPMSAVTWAEANAYVDRLNEAKHLGYADWRIPYIEELRSIVVYDGRVPAIDEAIFTDTKPGYFWSGEINKEDETLVWMLYFGYGCMVYLPKTQRHYLRAVRGGYNSYRCDYDNRYKDNGDGTITDLALGIMWAKGEVEPMTLLEGLKYCKGLDLAGFNDWQLPNMKELATLTCLSAGYPDWVRKDLFPDAYIKPMGFYISTTAFGGAFGWGANFQFGYDGYYADRKRGKYGIKPMRRGF